MPGRVLTRRCLVGQVLAQVRSPEEGLKPPGDREEIHCLPCLVSSGPRLLHVSSLAANVTLGPMGMLVILEVRCIVEEYAVIDATIDPAVGVVYINVRCVYICTRFVYA